MLSPMLIVHVNDTRFSQIITVLLKKKNSANIDFLRFCSIYNFININYTDYFNNL